MKPRVSLLLLPLLLIVGACSSQPADTTSPTPAQSATRTEPSSTRTASQQPSPSPSPEPTFSQSFPTPPEDESDEESAIRSGWEEYRRVWDMYLKDPSLGDLTETQYVTTGQESIDILNRITSIRHLEVKMIGDSYFHSVEIGPALDTAEGVRTATVVSCYDPSFRSTVDVNTGELSELQAEHTSLETVTMELGLDGIWRAALYLNEGQEC